MLYYFPSINAQIKSHVHPMKIWRALHFENFTKFSLYKFINAKQQIFLFGRFPLLHFDRLEIKFKFFDYFFIIHEIFVSFHFNFVPLD